MKLLSLTAAILTLFFYSCKSKDSSSGTPENDLDAGRMFIRAALDGKFDEARTLLLEDSVNTNFFELAQRAHSRFDAATRDGYRTSSIRIIQRNVLNDSTSILVYSNTFKNDPDTLKIVRVSGKWLIDLKYLFRHAMDTTRPQPMTKDSLP